MKRGKALRILIISISLLMFLFPAYSCYLTLSEMNLSSADMSYESPDQDDLSMNPQSEFRGLVASIPSMSIFCGDTPFKQLFDFPPQTGSTDQKSFTLRC